MFLTIYTNAKTRYNHSLHQHKFTFYITEKVFAIPLVCVCVYTFLLTNRATLIKAFVISDRVARLPQILVIMDEEALPDEPRMLLCIRTGM